MQAHPKKFDLMKIWAKSLKIRVKKAPNVACIKKITPKICRKTHEDLIWRSIQKKFFVIIVRENLL